MGSRSTTSIADDLRSENEWIRRGAIIRMLGKDPKAGQGLLVELLRSGRTRDIAFASRLGVSDVDAILPYANHPDWRARLAATLALLRCRGPRVESALRKLRRDPARFVRRLANAKPVP